MICRAAAPVAILPLPRRQAKRLPYNTAKGVRGYKQKAPGLATTRGFWVLGCPPSQEHPMELPQFRHL
jgi:hypothetical protein